MLIREIRQEELPLLEEFLYEAIFVPEGMMPFDRTIIYDPSVNLYIDNFGQQEDDFCFVAEINDQVVGAVWVRILAGVPRGYGYIDSSTPEFGISLFKNFRGKGIGTRLMLNMIEHLRKKGYEKTSLSVHKGNYAEQMYRKVGFELVEERDEDLLMVLKL